MCFWQSLVVYLKLCQTSMTELKTKIKDALLHYTKNEISH